VAIAGDSPIAVALAELCGMLGFAARRGDEAQPGDFAAVVASMGHGDEDAVRGALAAECEYVGLVASRRRGAAVLDALRAGGVPDDAVARVRTPAGLDIGARTHAEVALAIAAELVAARRARVVAPDPGGDAGAADAGAADAVRRGGAAVEGGRGAEAVDPVCGMTVAVSAATPTAGGHAFCCEGCREAWLARA
jgi:xanthine dehydrogenase accessory factor